MIDNRTKQAAGIRWLRLVTLICCAIGLYVFGRSLAHVLIQQFSLHIRASNEPMVHRALMTATAVYIVLMVIPFMPAAEIGFSMLMVFGAKIAFLVYVSTVTALTLAYLIGRLLPEALVARAFGTLGLARAQTFVNRLDGLSAEQRVHRLAHDSAARLVPALVRHRFLALAVLLNVPGNVVIGGGGGIALVAGMSRLFPLPAYLLTVALAVAPVPLIVSLTEAI